MKQEIKDIIMKYLDPKPKYDGISADEIAEMILKVINTPQIG